MIKANEVWEKFANEKGSLYNTFKERVESVPQKMLLNGRFKEYVGIPEVLIPLLTKNRIFYRTVNKNNPIIKELLDAGYKLKIRVVGSYCDLIISLT